MKEIDGEAYFHHLGFDNKTSKVLSWLVKKDKQSILNIARNTEIERTKVYRIIDELLKGGYIVQTRDYKRNYYKIGSIERFKTLKDSQEKIAQTINSQWADFVLLFVNSKNSSRTTDVRYYRGANGIKQILWNELQAEHEVLSFTYRNLQDIVGRKFFLKWGQEFDRRKLINKDLRSESFDEYDKKLGFKRAPFKGDRIKYLPDKYLDAPLAVDIYNDIVVIYDWRDNDVFAVEIQNAKFADFMKKIFRRYWKKGLNSV